MSAQLERLCSMVQKLPDLVSSRQPGMVTYCMADGKAAFGVKLLRQDFVAVQNVFMPAGVFPRHSHAEREWVMLYCGKLRLIMDDDNKDRVLTPGDGAFLESNTAHSLEALENSWMICVTIPAGEGYPNGHTAGTARQSEKCASAAGLVAE